MSEMVHTKHTPGPWRLRGLSDHVRVEHVNSEFNSRDTVNVARCGSSKPGPREPDTETVFANARLIAAAPVAYEMAEAVLAQMDDGVDRSGYINTRAIEFMNIARGTK